MPVEVIDEQGRTIAWRYPGEGVDGEDVEFPVVSRAQKPDEAALWQRCFSGEFCDFGRRATFESSDGVDAKVRTALLGWVAAFDELRAQRRAGLILYGPPGVGKTHLAACCCNALIGRGRRCRMTTLRTVMDSIAESYGECGRAVASLARNDLVVLDDFGGERDTATAREQVFAIVDGLEKRGVPLVVTTNLARAQLANPDPGHADLRVYDRIKGQAHAAVEVTGPNRRQTRARA